MARQLIVIVLILLGLGAIHAAGTHRPLVPKPSEDPYAWLGPLPAPISQAEGRNSLGRLLGRMESDARGVDIRRFVCRDPAEIGALPMMSAVMRYADNLPGSQDDKALTDGLVQAAARGNWLARTMLFSLLIGDNDTTSYYRGFQLAEWLHRNGFGQVYTELAPYAGWLDDSERYGGNDPAGFLAVAAMRHDFVMQASVGRALISMDDPELVAIGGRMMACAANARAVYRDNSQGRIDSKRAVRGMAERAGQEIGKLP